MQVILLTALALIAFAANSILCRMALGADRIDPISFTTIRLLSGAILLFPLGAAARRSAARADGRGSWRSGLALFVYAICFSLAYVRIEAGVGALILFGAVQTTMVGIGLREGERPHVSEWLGLLVAVGGLIYLISPGRSAPDAAGSLLMGMSGVAWGVYSLRGRGARIPVAITADNFLRTAPMTLAASAFFFASIRSDARGFLLAATSGAITSGIGYVIWYRALRGLTATRAALVQLLVPVIAAFAGILFLGESVTIRLLVASLLILGGVALAIGRRRG